MTADAGNEPTAFYAIADEFFQALERGDMARIASLYHPEAIIWHNIDDHEASAADNVRSLDSYFQRVPERRYEDIIRHPIVDGLIQEHLFVGRTVGGAPIRTPMCLVIHFFEGRIYEIREYLDSAHRTTILAG